MRRDEAVPFSVCGMACVSRKEVKAGALVRLEECCLGPGRVTRDGCLGTNSTVISGCSASLSAVNRCAEKGEMA